MRQFLAVVVAAAIGGLVVWALFFQPVAPQRTIDITMNKNYVAMGDSIAAGAGTGGASNGCGVTDNAYPSVVASSLSLSLTNVACGGATLEQGILGSQSAGNDSQLDQLFRLSTPSVITLTIGANDVKWVSLLDDCFNHCQSADDKAIFETNVKAVSTNLQSLYRSLKSHYDQAVPQVFVTGYYAIFPTGATSIAAREVGLSANDVTWIESLRKELNDTIEQASKAYDFVTYVPVDYSGHELFTSESWLQGQQDPAPVHPNTAGQAAIGQAVVAAIKAQEN